MPWKNNSCAEQRWGFVRLAMRYKTRLAELCRQTGISRKTAYKWIERFKERGRRGLRNKTHCAHQVHNRPKNKWLHRIRCRKRRHPNWGAPKIWWVFKRALWSQEAAFRGGHQSLAQELGLNQKAQKTNPQRSLHCAAGFEGSQISQRGA